MSWNKIKMRKPETLPPLSEQKLFYDKESDKIFIATAFWDNTDTSYFIHILGNYHCYKLTENHYWQNLPDKPKGEIKMYICYNCKTTVDELPTYEEHMGECHGTPAYERMTDNSCTCGHEYDEAVMCPICGDWKHEDDLEYGACDECINDSTIIPDIMIEYVDTHVPWSVVHEVQLEFDRNNKKASPAEVLKEVVFGDKYHYVEWLIERNEEGK